MHETAHFTGQAAQCLEHVRQLALGYPEAHEVEQFGHPWFKAGKRPFAIVGLQDGRATLALATSKDDQAGLCQMPMFYPTPYMHQHGWTSTVLEDEPDWSLLDELLDAAYRNVALKRMLAALDG